MRLGFFALSFLFLAVSVSATGLNTSYPYNLSKVDGVSDFTSLLVVVEGYAPVAEFIVIIVCMVAFGIAKLFNDVSSSIVASMFISMLVSLLLVLSGALNEAWLYATTLLFSASLLVKLYSKSS